MLEVEVKYRSPPDRAGLTAVLNAWGATLTEPRVDEDHYYNAPDRDFRRTDEAFRLRRIGTRNLLTYKGPKIDLETKTRPEIEVPLADGDEPARDAGRMFVSLGFRPVAVVRKRRDVYRVTRGGFVLEVCLDEVDRVGSFVELEIQADEADYERAKAVVLDAARELGLTEMVRKSYLGMVLES